jgi:undecaprenyl-diphosphatase
MDLNTLLNIDRYMLLSLNGSDSLFWDGCMLVYTSMAVWAPLALMLLYVLLKNNNIKDFLLLLFFVALVVLLTDQISSGFCKPFFARWRPTNDPMLMYAVDIVNETRGGKYGFTSSHAANSFGIATFMLLLVKNRALTVSLIFWASMNAFTRMYLGVHYPGDILAGTLINAACGLDTMTAFTASVASTGNIGPGFGEVGSLANFSAMPIVVKIVCTLQMLLGRLEIFGLLQFFLMKWWR